MYGDRELFTKIIRRRRIAASIKYKPDLTNI